MSIAYHYADAVLACHDETKAEESRARWYRRRWTLQEIALAEKCFHYFNEELEEVSKTELETYRNIDAKTALKMSSEREGGLPQDLIYCIRRMVPALYKIPAVIDANVSVNDLLRRLATVAARAGDASLIEYGRDDEASGLCVIGERKTRIARRTDFEIHEDGVRNCVTVLSELVLPLYIASTCSANQRKDRFALPIITQLNTDPPPFHASSPFATLQSALSTLRVCLSRLPPNSDGRARLILLISNLSTARTEKDHHNSLVFLSELHCSVCSCTLCDRLQASGQHPRPPGSPPKPVTQESVLNALSASFEFRTSTDLQTTAAVLKPSGRVDRSRGSTVFSVRQCRLHSRRLIREGSANPLAVCVDTLENPPCGGVQGDL
ncbi:hypothetical protein HK102_006127, partial [Quaeritorhiza haematococci]